MPKGGYRPGAGRPIGSRTGANRRSVFEPLDEKRVLHKRTAKEMHALDADDLRLQLERTAETPLHIMVKGMLEMYRAKGAMAAFKLAAEIAPYMHSKLAAIEVKGEVDNRHFVISAGQPMTREEWLKIYGGTEMGLLAAVPDQPGDE